jgi:hypothetical protein
MKFLRISIHTAIECNEALSKVREAIGGCGGWIVDHSLFSNALATVNTELPPSKTELFIGKLEDATFHPRIDVEVPEGEEGDLRVQVQLTFIHQDPDLKRNVPAFG